MVSDVSTGLSNSTAGDVAVEERGLMSFEEQAGYVVLMTSCIGVTVIGNVLVILSVFTYRPLRNVQNFYIVSLACADLAVALIVMPFNVVTFALGGRWIFGEVFCNIWLTCDILTCTASILNLCGIAVDRYCAIHDPITYSQRRTASRVMVNLVIIWLLSAVISIPPLIGWNNRAGESLYDGVKQVCQLTDDRGFVIYSASGSFYIPLCLMTFVYVKIFLATRARLRARANAAAVLSPATQSGGVAGSAYGSDQMDWNRPTAVLRTDGSLESLRVDDANESAIGIKLGRYEYLPGSVSGSCLLSAHQTEGSTGRLTDSSQRGASTGDSTLMRSCSVKETTRFGGLQATSSLIDICKINYELKQNSKASSCLGTEKSSVWKESNSSFAKDSAKRGTSENNDIPVTREQHMCGPTRTGLRRMRKMKSYVLQKFNMNASMVPETGNRNTLAVVGSSTIKCRELLVPKRELARDRVSEIKDAVSKFTDSDISWCHEHSMGHNRWTKFRTGKRKITSPLKIILPPTTTPPFREQQTTEEPASSPLPETNLLSRGSSRYLAVPKFTTEQLLHCKTSQSDKTTKFLAKMRHDDRKSDLNGSQQRDFWSEKQRISLAKERRVARTMAIIMAAFVVCWLPFFLMYVIFPFCEVCAASTDQRLVNFIVWLGYVNSTLNPIIYTIFNVDFRRAFVILLRGKRCSN